jgi:hypothetical protein
MVRHLGCKVNARSTTVRHRNGHCGLQKYLPDNLGRSTGKMATCVQRKGWSRLKGVLRPAKNVFQKVERAENSYATNVPVLIGLSRLLKIERVLEFGCGQYSTLTFLNRSAFPYLTKLQSFETDGEWLEKIAQSTKGDSRIQLTLVDTSMSSAAHKTELASYDLIFLDDSTSADERAATIRQIAGKNSAVNLAVIHDYEIKAYRHAASGFRNSFRFDSLNPNTGVVWNKPSIDKGRLKTLNLIIQQHARSIQLDDISGWTQLFSSLLGVRVG